MKPVRKQRPHSIVTALAVVLALACARPAAAQISFEPCDYQGSSDGIPLTDQQGWYLPSVAGSQSVEFFVFTYDSNALSLPQNAFGDTQFIGSEAVQMLQFPRAQLDFDWTQATVWTVTYDICVSYAGNPVAPNNISSFSLQDSTTARSFTAVNTWADTLGTIWAANYQVYNAAGVQQAFQIPTQDWNNLAVDNWYTQSVTFDLDQNLILSVSITDLTSGNTATASPDGWYLQGGANPGTRPLPTALRFFVGGVDATSSGNIAGFDNLIVAPSDRPIPGQRTKSISMPTDRSVAID